MEYKSEIKNCQNCKKDFIIESEDFNFYEKIKVPPPTFCPECRMIRRMIWRNCRSLFKRNCSNCKKSIISMYSPERTGLVHCMDCWNSDERDPFLLARNYDFKKTFFEQIKKLREESPILFSHHTGNLIRSDFTNYASNDKDCYLSYSILNSENILYSEIIDNSKNSLDCYAVQSVENCSYNTDCEKNYNTHYALRSRNCIDSYFINDCLNCQNCCLSTNLRNQKYMFKNKQLTKEGYKKELANLLLNTSSGLEKTKFLFNDIILNKSIYRFAQIYNSQNTIGDYIGNSKNIFKSFDVQNSENIHYVVRSASGAKDCWDNQGIAQGELIYESVASSFTTYKDYFTYICIGSKECEYSFMLKNCSNCFACIGLKNAQYCIFNKQYKKEEYYKTVEKIKNHMNDFPYIDSKGRIFKYGEFFPYDMSPFGYNETNAHDFFPITKEEVFEKGYLWKEKEKKNYEITMKSENLPDSIKEVEDSIISETISCPSNGNQDYQCTTAYRIVPNELIFYKQKNLPLPRYCPNCRHYQRLKYRNTMRLYNRKCMKQGCTNKFETTYAPDRPEIVYCEKCYQQEVY